ncbi:hypothetical protein MAFF241647_44170 (plasmid) [Ralstonia solanacearum]|nr:hypothetical protein MAFF241647_44170 [Ralstonia solanacearum]
MRELGQRDNAEIRCNAKTLEVLYDAASRRATGVAYLDLTDPDHPRRVEQLAETVIISCGAVQTSRLLLLSGPPEGLGNSSGQLGRNAMFHLFGLGMRTVLGEAFQGRLHGEWGLADTLSEKSGTPTATTATPPTGSTSRVIAFLGLIGMLSMFVGIGFYLLWALFNGKQDLAHQLDIAGHYLLYGSALFAPYAFNQIKSVFS